MPLAKTPFPHWAGSYVPLLYPGRQFFVNSAATNASDGNLGDSPTRPLATLNGAFDHGDILANNGDVIYVMPNHAETITGVGGITADIAGVTVIGLGRGAQRPRFLMDDATTVTFVVNAADIVLENLVFAAGFADIVRCFNITAAGFHAEALELVENVATENFLIPFDFSSITDGNADGPSVIACRSLGVDAAATEFIATAADIDGFVVRGNVVVQSGSTDGALIKCTAGSGLFNLDCRDNFLQHAMTANELLINNDQTDNTGIIAHNRVRHADVTTTHDLGIDALGCALFDNLSVSTDALSGFVLPAIDADS